MDLAAHGAWDAPAANVNLPRYRIAIAQQIRQDLWRVLRTTRGFSPVVDVASDHSGQGGAPGAIRVMVSAGGRLDVAQVPRAAMVATIGMPMLPAVHGRCRGMICDAAARGLAHVTQIFRPHAAHVAARAVSIHRTACLAFVRGWAACVFYPIKRG
jgi:hypothetical protein